MVIRVLVVAAVGSRPQLLLGSPVIGGPDGNLSEFRRFIRVGQGQGRRYPASH